MKRKEAKSTRYERWLSIIAAHLRTQKARTILAYDDRHLGDRLVLSVPLDEGFVELQVVRAPKGADLCLVAQNQPAADRLAALLRDLHKTAKRRHNAKRKFLHRFEWMSQHLQQTFEPRNQQFPEGALHRLRRLIPVCEPLIGVRAPFMKKLDPAADDRLELESATGRLGRQLKRYRLCFAALIPTRHQGRAALYYKNVDAFCPRGDGLNTVVEYLRQTPMDPATAALLAPPTPDGKQRSWQEIVGDVLDYVEVAGDVAETAANVADINDLELSDVADADVCWDMGGLDLPDCGACDVADCAGLGCDLPI